MYSCDEARDKFKTGETAGLGRSHARENESAGWGVACLTWL